MSVPFRLSAISAMTAALSMAVAPASAAELPVPVQAQTVPQVASWDVQDDVLRIITAIGVIGATAALMRAT